MILILSKENDYSTIDVIKWLKYFKVDYLRINGNDLDEKDKEVIIEIGNCTNTLTKVAEHNGENISVVWNRRFHDFKNAEKLTFNHTTLSKESSIKLVTFFKREIGKLYDYFLYSLKDSHWIDPMANVYVNKLKILESAKDVGLNIPATIVTNSKKRLLQFKEEKERVIVKPINEVELFKEGINLFMPYTSEITNEAICNLPDRFFPSLFQELIPKRYEVRSVFIDGEFYSMVIFSQRDKTTSVDFRNYNYKKWNRNVPYLLPKYVEHKLKVLAKKLSLKHASFDLIKTTDDNYIFLEVNPVGQFGMVSYPCNYHLEEKIAKMLIAYDK